MEHLLNVEPIPPYTVVSIETLSLMNPAELEWIGNAIAKLVDQGARSLLLDMSRVEYLSSQGIGILVQTKRKLDAHRDGSFVVCGLQPRIMQLMKLTRLDKVLNIKPTRKDAFGAAAK